VPSGLDDLFEGLKEPTGLLTSAAGPLTVPTSHFLVGRPLLRVSRLALIVLVVAILVTLVPLAHTSPPDPTWIPGVWDNADHDDVVILVTSDSGLVDASNGSRLGCLPHVLDGVREIATGGLAPRPLLPDCPRAPPTA